MLSERTKNFLEKLKEGDIVKFKVKDFGKDTIVGMTEDLENLKGKIDRVTRVMPVEVRGENHIVFKTRLSCESWADETMVAIPTKADIEKYVEEHKDEGVEKRTYLDFKVGDLVKIRDWEDMIRQYGCNDVNNIPVDDEYSFTQSMKRYCGLKFIITGTGADNIKLAPYDHKNETSYFTITKNMLEIVEEDYRGRVQREMEEKMKQAKEEISGDIEQEMIGKVDKNKLSKILAGSVGLRTIDLKGVDALLQQWAKAKKEMYLVFGKRLKISKQIETEITENEVRPLVRDLCGKFPAIYPLFTEIYDSEIINNKMEHNPLRNWFSAPRINYTEGMKASKYIADAFKNKELDIEFSKLVSTSKSVGTIDISIDPVDYATMSMNKSGWSSCHSLHKDTGSRIAFGEWSAGTISYMVDEATIIAFRHSDTIFDYEYNGIKFKEYSKNWRELLYYDKLTHSFTANRQYPCDNEAVAKEVRTLFEDTIADYLGIENKWKSIKNFSNRRANVEDVTTLHYNDVLQNSSAVCRLVRLQDVDRANIRIKVGASPVCCVCGERALTDHHHPICDRCYCSL